MNSERSQTFADLLGIAVFFCLLNLGFTIVTDIERELPPSVSAKMFLTHGYRAIIYTICIYYILKLSKADVWWTVYPIIFVSHFTLYSVMKIIELQKYVPLNQLSPALLLICVRSAFAMVLAFLIVNSIRAKLKSAEPKRHQSR